MDYPLLDEWFTLAANLGVLVGIVFLIIEIKQNTELHKSDSRKAIVSNDQASLLVALDNHDIFQKTGRGGNTFPSRPVSTKFRFCY
jgi:hypothetical protein